MTITDRIEINPRIMLGKPVIRGTCIPVELILCKISEGATEADILDAYPGLVAEDIKFPWPVKTGPTPSASCASPRDIVSDVVSLNCG